MPFDGVFARILLSVRLTVAARESSERLYVSLRSGQLLALDTQTWQQLWECSSDRTSHICSITSLGDDVCVGNVRGAVCLCDGATGAVRHTWNTGGGRISDLLACDDLRYLAAADHVGKIHLLPFDKPRGRQLLGHSEFCRCLALSHDGVTLASGGADGRILLWDALTGEQQMTINAHNGPIDHLWFSNDDHSLVSTSRDGCVRFWGAEKDSADRR